MLQIYFLFLCFLSLFISKLKWSVSHVFYSSDQYESLVPWTLQIVFSGAPGKQQGISFLFAVFNRNAFIYWVSFFAVLFLEDL